MSPELKRRRNQWCLEEETNVPHSSCWDGVPAGTQPEMCCSWRDLLQTAERKAWRADVGEERFDTGICEELHRRPKIQFICERGGADAEAAVLSTSPRRPENSSWRTCSIANRARKNKQDTQLLRKGLSCPLSVLLFFSLRIFLPSPPPPQLSQVKMNIPPTTNGFTVGCFIFPGSLKTNPLLSLKRKKKENPVLNWLFWEVSGHRCGMCHYLQEKGEKIQTELWVKYPPCPPLRSQRCHLTPTSSRPEPDGRSCETLTPQSISPKDSDFPAELTWKAASHSWWSRRTDGNTERADAETQLPTVELCCTGCTKEEVENQRSSLHYLILLLYFRF